MTSAFISPKTFSINLSSTSSSPSSSSSSPNYYQQQPLSCRCKYQLSGVDERNFVLHDALDASGIDTTHARAARAGFCSQIQKLCDIERETSISVNRKVDLGRAALHIAAEDDSLTLISHSSLPLPTHDFIPTFYSLSMDYCSHYSSSYRSSPEAFLECLDRYLYVDRGFRRTADQTKHRALYLNSVLRHRLGSVSMLSIIYSEILKVLRIWGVVDFDVEIFFPRDSHSCPKGYQKQKSTESDQLHVMTTQSLLVEMLKDLKNAFWPFQVDRPRSPFLRAAQAAQCLIGQNNNKESLFELASAKAARHRLQRGAGAWTISRFGDIRRALAACERLILLKTDPKELRDYAVLLYHCGFYEESLHFLKLYQHTKPQYSGSSDDDVEEEAVEKLIIRLNLIVMEEGWSRPHDS
ncbi:uncharacterized protein LOC127264124 isoform X2 [Andrographis paniculata]|uniref:uncharacterized protein LOC127264124 isoform X2 n=1 Tax=Andrographis paniculata TaxID=175694 RepID=UPI0021E6ED44|nr:uncharacterized protein LOC127264124 isoform X2 [Andrographis paniculata]